MNYSIEIIPYSDNTVSCVPVRSGTRVPVPGLTTRLEFTVSLSQFMLLVSVTIEMFSTKWISFSIRNERNSSFEYSIV